MNNIKKLADNKEFWNVKKAGERLQWRTSPNERGDFKTFKVNESDSNAVNSILGMINRIEKNNLANNTLFAKLYLIFLTQEIRHHETTVFNEDIFTIVNAKLNFPLESYYAAFINDLHGNQFNKILIDDGEKDQMKTVKMAQEFKEKHTPDFCIPKLNKAMNHALLTYS